MHTDLAVHFKRGQKSRKMLYPFTGIVLVQATEGCVGQSGGLFVLSKCMYTTINQ
jgi:hypothetical protein